MSNLFIACFLMFWEIGYIAFFYLSSPLESLTFFLQPSLFLWYMFVGKLAFQQLMKDSCLCCLLFFSSFFSWFSLSSEPSSLQSEQALVVSSAAGGWWKFWSGCLTFTWCMKCKCWINFRILANAISHFVEEFRILSASSCSFIVVFYFSILLF